MCDECKEMAESMVRSAQSRKGAPLPSWVTGPYRPPSAVIAKYNFVSTKLPIATTFSHVNGVPPKEIEKSGGLDPAVSSEICYSGDAAPGHVRWYDRMVFAAKPRKNQALSKLAQMQGYGTDSFGEGPQYAYEFVAPQGTLVRSTNGSLDGEVCFPELIPWDWITKVTEVARTKDGKRTENILYMKQNNDGKQTVE